MKEIILLEGFPISSPRGFLGWSNALLLDDDGTRVVVDTGGSGDRGTLLRRLQEAGLDGSSVEFLILTHLHFDHCLNLDLFPRATIVLGRREHEYVAGGAYRRQGDTGIPPFVLTLLEGRQVVFVEDDLDVSPGVRVLATPGHTPGSLSVLYTVNEGRRTMACADLVKNAWEFLNGPPSPEGRATLARLRPLATRWIPGHDRPFVVEGSSIHYEGAREVEMQVLLDARRTPAVTRWRFE
ncbi:MAG: MBL fold metallo-hydrolase [bacterium]